MAKGKVLIKCKSHYLYLSEVYFLVGMQVKSCSSMLQRDIFSVLLASHFLMPDFEEQRVKKDCCVFLCLVGKSCVTAQYW